MRKITPVLCALFLCLTACSPKPQPLVSPLAGRSGCYETQAAIRWKDWESAATIKQTLPGECLITFTAPDSIQGMSFQFFQDRIDVKFKGLSFRFDAGSLPDQAAVGMVVAAMDRTLQNREIAVAQTEEGISLSGTLDAGNYTLHLDPQQNVPKKLSIPSEEMEITFDDFQFFD